MRVVETDQEVGVLCRRFLKGRAQAVADDHNGRQPRTVTYRPRRVRPFLYEIVAFQNRAMAE